MVAARAAPKDYLGQVREIYNDFLKRWRYVRDPVGLETVARSPKALHQLVMGFNGGLGENIGAGDCDDAAAAIGALLGSVGFPVRLGTTAPLIARGRLFSHVFAQARVPGHGWITVDPVGYPKHDLGWTQPHSRIAYWDLFGRLLDARGISPRVLAGRLNGTEGEKKMAAFAQDFYKTQFVDHGLSGVEDLSTGEPAPWDEYGLLGFGCYSGSMGYIPNANHLPIEVTGADVVDEYGNVRTPMLELSADDYRYMERVHYPYDGMMALGDDGTIYEYDGTLGFFRRLARRIKRRVKKGVRAIKRGVRRVGRRVVKLVKKLPGAKYVIKLGKKLVKVALKIVKPLAKFVGKWALKIAPIAAMIPGVGPVIAGYLTAAGTAAKLMNKYGVKIAETIVRDKKGRKKKVKKLKFTDPKKAKAFKRALKKEAAKAKKLPKARLKRAVKALAKTPYKKRGGLPKRIKIKRKGTSALSGPVAQLDKMRRGVAVIDRRHLRAGTPEHRAQLKALGVRAGLRRRLGPGLVRLLRAKYLQKPIKRRAIARKRRAIPPAKRFKRARTTRWPMIRKPRTRFARTLTTGV